MVHRDNFDHATGTLVHRWRTAAEDRYVAARTAEIESLAAAMVWAYSARRWFQCLLPVGLMLIGFFGAWVAMFLLYAWRVDES